MIGSMKLWLIFIALALLPCLFFLGWQSAGSGELDGRFLVGLATCENAGTGKAIEWPPAPLTLRGGFEGLLPGAD